MSWTNAQIYGRMTVISFTGVDNTAGDTDTNGSASAQTTAISLLTPGANDMCVDGFSSSGGTGGSAPTAGADQTIRGETKEDAGHKEGCSTQLGSAGGALEWDNIQTDQVNQAGVILVALAAPSYQEPYFQAQIIE